VKYVQVVARGGGHIHRRGTLWAHLWEDEERVGFFQVLTGLSFYSEWARADRSGFTDRLKWYIVQDNPAASIRPSVYSYGNRFFVWEQSTRQGDNRRDLIN
jgi:hypothetical protein